MKNLAFLLLLVSFQAVGKESDCEKKSDTAAMVMACLIGESERPVKPALDAVIKALGTDKEAIDALKKAQSDWEKFKDSSCDYTAKTYYSYQGDGLANCLIDFNNARVKILKKYLKDAEQLAISE